MTDTPQKTLPADNDIRVTEPFVTRSGDYLNVIMRWWLRRYGLLLGLPVAVVAVAGVILRDERIAIIALVMVFIIMPMVMLFIYIYYMLTPQARRVVLRKRVTIATDRYLLLEYLSEPRDETEAADGEHQTDIPPGEAIFTLPEDEIIPWDDIGQVSSTSRFMVFVLRGKPRQLILIPYSSLNH